MSSDDAYATEVIPRDPVELVRKRPGMYVGDLTNGRGMHEMLWRVLEPVVEGGHHEVRIEIAGSRATVEHIGLHTTTDRLEHALTQLHGMFLHPCDFLQPTCALSRELEATVWCDGHTFVQRYRRGVAGGPFVASGRSERTGFACRSSLTSRSSRAAAGT